MPRIEGPTLGLNKEGNLFPKDTRVLLEPNPDARNPKTQLNPVVVFSGVNGAGKDYLASTLVNKGFNGRIVGFGDMLSRATGVEKGQLSKLMPSDLERHYPAIVEEALREAPTLLTAHPVWKQNGTVMFTPGTYIALNPICFVVITCDEEQVNGFRKQREEESGRPANCEDIGEIKHMQNATHSILFTFAQGNGSGLIIVRNTVENRDSNVEFLDQNLESWLANYCNIEQ